MRQALGGLVPASQKKIYFWRAPPEALEVGRLGADVYRDVHLVLLEELERLEDLGTIKTSTYNIVMAYIITALYSYGPTWVPSNIDLQYSYGLYHYGPI